MRRKKKGRTKKIVLIVVGVVAGVVLNFHPDVSWSVATLIVIGLTAATLLVSGLIPSRDLKYRGRVDALFARLSTPIGEDEKPVPEPGFRRALTVLLAVALAASGALFVAMSLPSLPELSGLLALAAGLVCSLLAVLIFRFAAGLRRPPAIPYHDRVVSHE